MLVYKNQLASYDKVKTKNTNFKISKLPHLQKKS